MKKFGSQSIKLDGCGDYLEYDLNLLDTDFSADFSIDFNVSSIGTKLVSLTDKNNTKKLVGIGIDNMSDDNNMSGDKWYHITVSRTNTEFSTFIDGIKQPDPIDNLVFVEEAAKLIADRMKSEADFSCDRWRAYGKKYSVTFYVDRMVVHSEFSPKTFDYYNLNCFDLVAGWLDEITDLIQKRRILNE